MRDPLAEIRDGYVRSRGGDPRDLYEREFGRVDPSAELLLHADDMPTEYVVGSKFWRGVGYGLGATTALLALCALVYFLSSAGSSAT